MSLRDKISDLKSEALKNKDELKLSTLRNLWSAMRNAEIDKKSDLNDAEIQEIVSRQIKQLKDSLSDFIRANRDDLIQKAEFEIKLLEEFLPEQLNDEELENIIKQTISESGESDPTQMGKIMGTVMQKVKGKADGKKVRELVISCLTK